jgi:hypothetical protein
MGLAMASPTRVTVFVPFAGSDAALHQSPPTRDGNLCTEVVVPHLWVHLKVAMVRVKVMVVVIKVVVRGQVFCRKVLINNIGSQVVSNALIEYPVHFLVDRAVDSLVAQIHRIDL